MHLRLWSVSILLLATLCLPAKAGVITLEFDNVPGGGVTTHDPYFEDGFRVFSRLLPASPNPAYAFYQGHYDLWCGLFGVCGPIGSVPAYDGTHFLGTDAGGPCRYFDANQNYLFTFGGCQGVVRIDHFGQLFSAIGLVNVFGGWTLTSSKGGSLFGTGSEIAFVGDLWEGVEWIDLTITSFVGSPLGFDNLRLAVPEPPTAALAVVLLVATLLIARRRQRSR